MLKKNKTKQKTNEDSLPYFQRLLKNGLGQRGRAELKRVKMETEKLESEELLKKHYGIDLVSTPIKKDEKQIYESPLDPSNINY